MNKRKSNKQGMFYGVDKTVEIGYALPFIEGSINKNYNTTILAESGGGMAIFAKMVDVKDDIPIIDLKHDYNKLNNNNLQIGKVSRSMCRDKKGITF